MNRIFLSCGLLLVFCTQCAIGQQNSNSAYNEAIKLAKSGQAFAIKRDWRNACAAYEQALKIYPNYPAVRVALANAYAESASLLKGQDATPYYKRAAELDPNNTRAKDWLNSSSSGSAGANAGPGTSSNLSVQANSVAKITDGKTESLSQSNSEPSDLASLPDEDRVPINKRLGRLMVNGEVNGKTIEMQFDTGAEVTMIGVNHLKEMGIDISKLKGEAAYIGGSGGSAIKTLIVPLTLRLGKTSRKIPFFVHPNLPSPPLVGQSFLRGLQYEVNNQLSVLILRKPKAEPVASKPIDPRDRNVVAFTMQGKSIVVNVDVCGKSVPMIFDTGADGIAFPLSVWKQLDLKAAHLLGMGTSTGVDGTRPVLAYRVEKIDFGPVNLRDVTVMVSNPGPHMPLLGQRVLGAEKYIIDEKRKLIIFHR